MKKTLFNSNLMAFTLMFASTLHAQEVGVAWAGQSGMASTVLEGVQERLAEIAPEITLDIHDALGSVDELDSVVKQFASSGKEAQIVLRSNGSVYLGENPPTIPTFIGGGNHPVELGAIQSMNTPGVMVTGVTYNIEITPVLESFMTLHPYMDSVLLLSQTNYSSSAIDWKGTKQACDELGLTCAQAFVSDRDDIIEVMQKNTGNYSAIILGNQAAVFENAATVIEYAPETPLFSYAEKGVKNGAAGGVIADDRKLGRMLADSLVDVVIGGKDVSKYPIKRDQTPKLMINMDAVDRYGLAVPASLLSIAELLE